MSFFNPNIQLNVVVILLETLKHTARYMVDLFTWEISKKKKMYTSTKRLIVFIPTLAAGTVSCSLIAGTFEESIPLTKCHSEWADFKKPFDQNVLQG